MLLRDLPPSSNLSLGSVLPFKHRKLGQTTTSKQFLAAQPLRPPSCSPVKGRSALCLEFYYTCLPPLWLSQMGFCTPQGPSEFFIAQPEQRWGLAVFLLALEWQTSSGSHRAWLQMTGVTPSPSTETQHLGTEEDDRLFTCLGKKIKLVSCGQFESLPLRLLNLQIRTRKINKDPQQVLALGSQEALRPILLLLA